MNLRWIKEKLKGLDKKTLIQIILSYPVSDDDLNLYSNDTKWNRFALEHTKPKKLRRLVYKHREAKFLKRFHEKRKMYNALTVWDVFEMARNGKICSIPSAPEKYGIIMKSNNDPVFKYL